VHSAQTCFCQALLSDNLAGQNGLGQSDAAMTPLSIQSPAVSRKVFLQLRQLIAAGQLSAGQALIETELAQRLMVSRPTLREALRELEAEGLATRSRARGLAVRRLSRRDVEELYEVRESLEALAAGRAAQRLAAAAADRRPFEDALALWQSAADSGQLLAFSEANRQLHSHVLVAAGNSHLPRLMDHTLIDLFAAQLRGWIAPHQLQAAAHEHVQLLQALLAGNAALAERLMRAHVRSSANNVLALPDDAF
jgi:DNA-binding GntR family transcriptional regulator